MIPEVISIFMRIIKNGASCSIKIYANFKVYRYGNSEVIRVSEGRSLRVEHKNKSEQERL